MSSDQERKALWLEHGQADLRVGGGLGWELRPWRRGRGGTGREERDMARGGGNPGLCFCGLYSSRFLFLPCHHPTLSPWGTPPGGGAAAAFPMQISRWC